MMQLFYIAIFTEMLTILLLLFKTPLRKVVIMGLDRLKRGTAPLVVKTIAGVIFAMMSVTAYSVSEIKSRPIDTVNPTDQILLARNILEASLMGFMLFLSFMVDKLHHYIRELRSLRKVMEAAKKQNRATDDGKSSSSSEELKVLEEEIAKLKAKMKQLESECKAREDEFKASEANAMALKKQSEGFMNEYNDLLEQNRHLRDQLHSLHH